MVRIQLQFDQGIPQFACSSCGNCNSVYGESLCSIQNRGCCWYFPKFTLHEIHKMSVSQEGLEVLDRILKVPGIKIYSYYLHAKGYYDEEGYKQYLKSGQDFPEGVEDKTTFFRACPFVGTGKGCTLPVKYRSSICNFFICDEVVKEAEKYAAFKDYIKERSHYVKWIEWENYSLEVILKEKGYNLLNNFDEVINVLKDIPLENYEFPSLPPIGEESEFPIGA